MSTPDETATQPDTSETETETAYADEIEGRFNGIDLSNLWSDGEPDADESNDEDSGSDSDFDSDADETEEEPETEEAPSAARRRFLAAARKEKELLERENALKQREAETKAYAEAKARLGTDPKKALIEMGVDPDDFLGRLSEIYLAEGEPTTPDPVKVLEEKVARLEREKEEIREAERIRAEAAEAETKARSAVKAIVAAKADLFPDVVAQGLEGKVYELCFRYYTDPKNGGATIDPLVVAAALQKKISGGNSLKSKTPVAKSKTTTMTPKPKPKTLSSTLSKSSSRRPPELPDDPIERRRAIADEMGRDFWQD